jgi:PAP2 superfamily
VSIAVPRQRADGSTPRSAPRPHRQSGSDQPAGRTPRWWTELLLIAVLYAAYSCGRMLATGKVATAIAHGKRILHIELILHIDIERTLNHLLSSSTVLGVVCDFSYAALHYLITPAVLVWLWKRHAGHYRTARTWLAISTVLGLVGFTLMPTAPPRLLDHSYGFVDTMAEYASFGWWGADASAPRGLGGMTNEYAAMPSLHVGWSLWCGVMLWRFGRTPLLRTLGVLYPLAITFVVMGTANHYLLDVVAGALVMCLGGILARPGVWAANRVRAELAKKSEERRAKAPGAAAVTAPAAAQAESTGMRVAPPPQDRAVRGKPDAGAKAPPAAAAEQSAASEDRAGPEPAPERTSARSTNGEAEADAEADDDSGAGTAPVIPLPTSRRGPKPGVERGKAVGS